jgi:hypothetical protein
VEAEVPKDHRVCKDLKVNRDHKVKVVLRASQDRGDCKDLKVFKGTLDLLVTLFNLY